MNYVIALIALFMLNETAAFSQEYVVASRKYKDPVVSVNVSPDGKWLLTGLENGTLDILTLPDLEEKLLLEEATGNAIFDIEMSPSMDVIFVASGNRITLFDTLGVYINNFPVHKNTMWSMDISPDGKWMVSTEVNKTFQLTDIYEGEIKKSIRGHDDITLAVDYSPDNKMFASGSSDRRVLIWDADTYEKIGEYHGHSDNIYDVAFSPDASLIASCSKDRTVRVWDIGENKLIHLLKGHQDMVLEIEFSPDGKYLLSASADQAINLWNLETGDLIHSFTDNTASVPDIVFVDNDHFASVCMDGTLKLHKLEPELFVLRYFYDQFMEDIKSDPQFAPRQKGEKKSDYQARQKAAGEARQELIQNYYSKYLNGDHLKQE